MFRTTFIAMTILACASLAAAQSDDYKKFDLFAGYSHNFINNTIGAEGFGDDPQGYPGFNASVTGNVSRYVGLKFDFSGHFKNRTILFGPVVNGIDLHSRLYNILGGVQIKDNSSETTFKPFVHVLAGAAHMRNRVDINNDVCIAIFPVPCPGDFTEKDTGFAAAFGGGLDVRVSDRIDIRILQLDYLPTRRFDDTQQTLRVGIGIVFH